MYIPYRCNIYTYIHRRIYINIYIYICTYIYTFIYMYVHVYIYIQYIYELQKRVKEQLFTYKVSATHCNTLQHTGTSGSTSCSESCTATHCNTLQSIQYTKSLRMLYKRLYIHTCIQIYIYVYTHIHVHINRYIYIYTYIYIYVYSYISYKGKRKRAITQIQSLQ